MSRRFVSFACVGWVLAACSGTVTIVDPNADLQSRPGGNGVGKGTPAAEPGVASVQAALCPGAVIATPVRRLSHSEYNRTVKSLLPGVAIPTQEFAADLSVHGFENNAAALNPSPMLLEQYSEAASRIAELAGKALDKLLPCNPKGAEMDCGRQFIASFGRRAFRRPLTSDEQARYEALFGQQLTGISFNAAAELTISAFLQSPQFLYRLEPGGPGEIPGQAMPLDDYAMASRLSYLMWQSMPDDALLDAAARGELKTPAQVEAQARRMLGDPATQAAIVDFHRQWLGFDRVLDENKDPQLFPDWTDALRDAMRSESDRFVGYVFAQPAATLGDLLTSTVSFVNRPLAALYGVSVSSDAWQMVSLPSAQRAGLLTRADFLAGRAHTTNGSPPLRGVAVLDDLLCSPPSPPPANTNATAPVSDPNMAQTNRQLFEERTASATCQACHKAINGIGYGLEAYDSIGRYRSDDHGMPVDAHGELIGTDVDGPFGDALELSSRLAASRQVQNCAVKNWYRYAFGRTDDSSDACMLEGYYQSMEQSGGDMRELLVKIATSYTFMHRPGLSP